MFRMNSTRLKKFCKMCQNGLSIIGKEKYYPAIFIFFPRKEIFEIVGESLRLAKVAELLKEEIGLIINKELKDPRLGIVTVTAVDISPDLKKATVHIGVLGSKKEKERSIKVLDQSKGFIQGTIGQRLRIKYTPSLHFQLDESAEYSLRIAKILKNIKKQESKE